MPHKTVVSKCTTTTPTVQLFCKAVSSDGMCALLDFIGIMLLGTLCKETREMLRFNIELIIAAQWPPSWPPGGLSKCDAAKFLVLRKEEVIKKTKGICAKVDAKMLFTIANSTKKSWEARMASSQHRVDKSKQSERSERTKVKWSNGISMHNSKQALAKLNALPKTPRNAKQLAKMLEMAESRKAAQDAAAAARLA